MASYALEPLSGGHRRGNRWWATTEVASILDRLGTTASQWQLTMNRLLLRPRAVEVAFAFHRERLQEAAMKRGCHHLANLNGCPNNAGRPDRRKRGEVVWEWCVPPALLAVDCSVCGGGLS